MRTGMGTGMTTGILSLMIDTSSMMDGVTSLYPPHPLANLTASLLLQCQYPFWPYLEKFEI